jgi:hypothetical protein
MKFFQPVNGTCHQEIPDFVAAIVVDQCAPFEVLTAARVTVFI